MASPESTTRPLLVVNARLFAHIISFANVSLIDVISSSSSNSSVTTAVGLPDRLPTVPWNTSLSKRNCTRSTWSDVWCTRTAVIR